MTHQIEAVKKHSELLKQQNEELGQELQIMVETDELIRDKLNRRDKVMTMKERNDYEIERSRHHLERSKSPGKRY